MITVTTAQRKRQEANRLCYLFLIFLTGCLVSWVYEEIFYWITEGLLRNRGILYGPWLPIYGIVCLRTVVSFALVGLVFHYRLEPTGPLTVQKLKPKTVRTVWTTRTLKPFSFSSICLYRCILPFF